MRILVLNHNLRERGTYFRARRVALGLHERGHSVTFVTTGEGYYRARRRRPREGWTELETANWTPLREPGDGYSPVGFVQRMGLVLQRWDLVYTFSHLPVDQGIARWIRGMGRGRKPFWITDWCDLWDSGRGGLHDMRLWQKPLPDWTQGLKGWAIRKSFVADDVLERQSARCADAVSIIARPMRKYTRQLGVTDERVVHLVSGADTDAIRPLDPGECRRKLGLPEDRLILGYVANATPDNKQLEKALALVWRELPELLMLSVGPCWYRQGGVAAKAVADGRLIDFDRRPFAEVPVYLGASDLLVMPLTAKPFNLCRWPNKFGDYMAAGRATATCNVGDMGRVIREGGVGAAGKPTAEGLAEAILALARDPDRRDRAGRRARLYAESILGWNRQITHLCLFLRRHGLEV